MNLIAVVFIEFIASC